jgi:O-antigen/teichoic acid export membrane protein
MRKHLTNGVYGVLDYASYPFAMLLVAPLVLHRLGAAEYGVWMIATAVISSGGIIASGFCDANIQRVARLRGAGETESMVATVRSMLGINLLIGITLALAAWFAAPQAAIHITAASRTPMRECLVCLRIASALILVRAVESVSVSTQRAFQRYRDPVKVAVAVRILTLGSVALLVHFHYSSIAMLTATAIFLILGTGVQLHQLWKLLGKFSLWPSFHPTETRFLLSFGVFAWAQALGGIVFGQLDRLMLGVYLGAIALAPYALCIQFAQPIFGLTASGLNFLFPYISGRETTATPEELTRIVAKAFVCNLLLVFIAAGALLTFGARLIELWAGHAVGHSAAAILPPIVIGSALMALGVTGTYAMQALGLFRAVACISLSGRAATLALMVYLLHHMGLQGLAIARVWYGAIALLVYLPLVYELAIKRKKTTPIASLTIAPSLHEGSSL